MTNEVSGSSTASSSSSRGIFPFLQRLQHGVFYFPTSQSTTPLEDDENNYKRFIFVPTGYINRIEQSLWRILNAFNITKLPPLIMNVASASIAEDDKNDKSSAPLTDTNDHPEKNQNPSSTETALLESAVDLCSSIGAWIIPERPWNYDQSAYDIVQAIGSHEYKQQQSKGTTKSISLGLFSLDQTATNYDHAESETISKACQFLSNIITGNMIPFVVNNTSTHSQTQINPPIITFDGIAIEDQKYLPCSNLSHFIIFENHIDKVLFQSKLNDLVPDLLLAFGNITNSTKEQIFSSIVHGSPISLICNGTGSATDKFAQMFQHVNKEIVKHFSQVSEGTEIVNSNTLLSEQSSKDNIVPSGSTDTSQNSWIYNFDHFGGVNASLSIVTADSTNTNSSGGVDPSTSTIGIPAMTTTQNDKTNTNDKDYEMINMFLKSWPVHYKAEKIVIMDQSEANNDIRSYEKQVQYQTMFKERLLVAVTSAFSPTPVQSPKALDPEPPKESILKKMTSAVAAAECMYAEACINVLRRTLFVKKLQTIAFQILLIVTTFLAITVPVVYAKVYGGKSFTTSSKGLDEEILIIADNTDDSAISEKVKTFHEDITGGLNEYLLSAGLNVTNLTDIAMTTVSELDIVQVALYLATLVLPMVVVYLQKANNQTKPDAYLKSWSSLELSAAQLESEIIKFRAQVAEYTPYNVTDEETRDDNVVMDKGVTSAGKFWGSLVSKSHQIWKDVDHLVSEGDKKGLITTIEKYKGQASDTINKKGVTEAFSESKARQIVIGKGTPDSDTDLEKGEVAPLLPVLSISVDEEDERTNQKQNVVHYDPSSWEKTKRVYCDYPYYDSVSFIPTDTFGQVSSRHQIDTKHDLDQPSKLTSIDYFVPMTVDEYIETRMNLELLRKSKYLSRMYNRNNMVTKLITYLTSSTAILAAFSYQWFIPIVLGLTSALGMDQENQKFNQRYKVGCSMVAELEELKSWWLNLSDDDKLQEKNKERLVVESERVIMSDAFGVFGNN